MENFIGDGMRTGSDVFHSPFLSPFGDICRVVLKGYSPASIP